MKRFIVILSCLCLWVSFIWAFTPLPLDSPVVVDYTPTGGTGGNWGRSTARDSHGWIYAVYTMDTNYLVQLSRSADNGRTWSRFSLLQYPWSICPNIVIDRGDSIYVNWERMYVDTLGWDIYFSKYNGVSWTPQVNVSNQHITGTTESSSIAIDGRGVPHLTWLGAGLDVWYCYYTNNAWSTPENLTQGSGSWVASMCADTSDNLHLVNQAWEIYYWKRSGGVWQPRELASPIRGWGPCVATDLYLRPHVAYSDTTRRVAYVRRDSAGWTVPFYISGDSLGGGPSITCDKYGHLYVVWVGYESKAKLWYATYDGTSWSAPVRLRNDTAYGDYSPRLGFPVSDSGVDLIWTMNNPSGSGYRVMYWRLPLLPSGVEVERPVEPRGEGLQLSVRSPVRSQLVVRYFLPQSKIQNLKSKISLYDLSGRLVAMLDEGVKPFGWHELKAPLKIPSGVYFLRLEAGKSSLTRKFVLLR